VESFMAEKTPQEGEAIPSASFRIDWNVPNDVQTRYATNLVVQSAAHEYIISFFEIRPPILLGSPEERQVTAQEIKSLPATCVARIVVARDKMPEFAKVLHDHVMKSNPTPDKSE
jgi:hypothetical protein